MDVKYVPKSCLVGEAEGYFQYTFIDEYSRFRIRKTYREQSSYSSAQFLKYVVERFPYAIECIQTENVVGTFVSTIILSLQKILVAKDSYRNRLIGGDFMRYCRKSPDAFSFTKKTDAC